jgi:opine dehydrogenase
MEDVPFGLVPLEAVGLYFGVDMSHTTLIIDLANKLLDVDFRAQGRNLENLGMGNGDENLWELIKRRPAACE